MEAARSRRRSEESFRTTESQEKSSFETARTSLQRESVERADAAHVNPNRDSMISVPGSWCSD